MRKLFILLGVALAFITTSIARAQTLADHVPGDSFVYFGWKGYETPGSGYDGSHLQAVLQASNFKAIFNDVLPQMIKMASKESPEAQKNVDTAMTIAAPLFKHPTAIFIRPGTIPTQPIRGGLICQAGADAKTLAKNLNDAFAKLPDAKDAFRVIEADDAVTVLVGYSDADIKVADKSMLAGNATFTSAQKMAGGANDSFVAVYADVDAALALADSNMKSAPANERAELMKARDVAGISGLHRVFVSGNFESKNWTTASFVDAPAPRRGFLKILEGRPVEADLYKLIPVTAASADVARVDLFAIANLVRELMGVFDPVNGEAKFDNAMDVAQQFTGLNPVTDVLQPLGDTFVSFSDEKIAGNDSLGMVFVNPLRDAATAEKSLTTLWGLATNMLNGPMGQAAHGQLSIGEEKMDDMVVHTIQTPQFTAGWLVNDGKLFIGFKAEGAVAAAKMPAQKTGFDQNPKFAELSKQLAGDHPISSFRFSDLTMTAPLMLTSLDQAWGMARMMAGMQGINLPDTVLPTLDALKPHLSPSVDVSWSDAKGFYSKSISPFPGADTFSNAPNQKMISTGGAALGVSILLPSLNRARETANRIKCASNERQIGQAILLYSNDNKGAYPPDLGTLIKTQDITLEVFICPSGNNELPGEIDKMTPDQMAEWINKNGDYVFVGQGLNNSTVPADRVIVYEKETDHGRDGVNMLYGDGHVEFQLMPEAKKIIEGLKGK